MKRQTWADLSIFAAIANAGSFTRAATDLGVSPSALSHAMRALEERLGVRLLNRSTRSVSATEAGEQLLERLRPAMRDLEHALSRLEDGRDTPSGRVRISAHRTAAMLAIAPRLPAFSRAYPDVQVELEVEDGLVDIVARSFDAGVRHEDVLDGDMISVRISGPAQSCYVASPDYWRRHGTPVEPRELLEHRCLLYRFTSSNALLRWRFDKDGSVLSIDPPAVLVSNDIDVIVEAALGGMGVAWLLEAQIREQLKDSDLVPALADHAPLLPPNFLYYSNRRQMTSAMRAFIDMMKHSA